MMLQGGACMAHDDKGCDLEPRVRTIELMMNMTAVVFAVFGTLMWWLVIVG